MSLLFFLNVIILSFIPQPPSSCSLLITIHGKGKLTGLIILSTTTNSRNEFKLEILKAFPLHKRIYSLETKYLFKELLEVFEHTREMKQQIKYFIYMQ